MTTQVEQLTADVVRLRADNSEQSAVLAQQQKDLAKRDQELRSGQANWEADRARALAEAQQQRESAERAAAAAGAREEQLGRELKGLRGRLERAQQINPPPSVLSASSLAITILALLATSALAFWFSAAKSARDQVQELEELRLQAEEQEVSASLLHLCLPRFSICTRAFPKVQACCDVDDLQNTAVAVVEHVQLLSSAHHSWPLHAMPCNSNDSGCDSCIWCTLHSDVGSYVSRNVTWRRRA